MGMGMYVCACTRACVCDYTAVGRHPACVTNDFVSCFFFSFFPHFVGPPFSLQVTLREMCSIVFFKAPPRELKDIVAFLSMEKTPRLQHEERRVPTAAEVADLRAIFDMYDEDGSGYLDRMEIYKALGCVAGYSAQTGLSLAELDKMIDEADEDGSGEIDKEEFVEMMSHVSQGVSTFDAW